MKNTKPALLPLTLVALLSTLSGCDQPPDLVTEAAGHAISARIQGPHSLVTEAGQAVISGPFGNVTIEQGRLNVNGGRWTSIPEGAPVRLEMARARVRIKAGNVTISHSVR
jgi:hypothetical protein